MQVAPRATLRRRFFRFAAGLLAAAAAGLVFVVWSCAAPASFRAASNEDGPIEYATVLAFLVAAIGFAVAARRIGGRVRTRPARRRGLLFLTGCSLVMFFFVGEELSWGQRLLGFDTPEPLRRLNEQHEFNVHNLGPLQRLKYTLLVATVALVGLVLPSLRLSASTRRLARTIGLPHPSPAGVGLFMVSLFFLRHAANWLGLAERHAPQEVGEFFFALAMAGVGISAARAAARRPAFASSRAASLLLPPPPLPPPNSKAPALRATDEPQVPVGTRRD